MRCCPKSLHQWYAVSRPRVPDRFSLGTSTTHSGRTGARIWASPPDCPAFSANPSYKIAKGKRRSVVTLHSPKHHHEVRYRPLALRSSGCCHGGNRRCLANRRWYTYALHRRWQWYRMRVYQGSAKCLANRRRTEAPAQFWRRQTEAVQRIRLKGSLIVDWFGRYSISKLMRKCRAALHKIHPLKGGPKNMIKMESMLSHLCKI